MCLDHYQTHQILLVLPLLPSMPFELPSMSHRKRQSVSFPTMKFSNSKFSFFEVDQPFSNFQIHLFLSPDCTCVYGFHEFHAYRSGECTKALFSEMCVMTPRDSTGVMSDNDFQRTGVIYPSMVSNSLWALSTKVGTTDSK